MQLVSACCMTFCRGEREMVETVVLCMTDGLLPVLHGLRARQYTGQDSELHRDQNAVCKAIVTVRLEGCPRRRAAGVALPEPPRLQHTHGKHSSAPVAPVASPGRPAPVRLRAMVGVPGAPRSGRGQ